MKKILAFASILSIATLSNSIFSSPAKAVDADVDINVNVPEVVYLQTYESITYDLDAADILNATDNPEYVPGISIKKDGTVTGGTTLGAPSFSVNAPITTTDFLAYRVWGIGGATGKLQATVAYTGSQLTKTTATTPSVVGIKLASPTAPVSADALGLDPTKPTINGLVKFDFDLKGATQSGLHTADPLGTDGLKITATAI